MTKSIRHNTPSSRTHTAHILSRNPRKTSVFISIGVGSGGVLLLFVLLTHTPPKIEIQVETIDVSPRVFRSRSTTPHDSLTDFQKTEFYRTIVDNNLFHPLGWTPPDPREPYRLIGTLIPRTENTPKQAILQKTPAGRTYTVRIGNKLDADTTVTDIQSKQVTLQRNGQHRTFTLNTTPLIK